MTGVSYKPVYECSESAFVHDKLSFLQTAILLLYHTSYCIFSAEGHNEYH